MKRRLTVFTAAALLIATIALGGSALGDFAPTTHAAPAAQVCTNVIWKTLGDTGTKYDIQVWQTKGPYVILVNMKLVRYGAYDSTYTTYYCGQSKAQAWVKCYNGVTCYPGFFDIQFGGTDSFFQFSSSGTPDNSTVSTTTQPVYVSTSTKAQLRYSNQNNVFVYLTV